MIDDINVGLSPCVWSCCSVPASYRKLPTDVCNEQGGFSPSSRRVNLTAVCQGRIRVAPLSPAQLKVGKY